MLQGGGKVSLIVTRAWMDLSLLIRKELQIRGWGIERTRNSGYILHVGSVYRFFYFLVLSPIARFFNSEDF